MEEKSILQKHFRLYVTFKSDNYNNLKCHKMTFDDFQSMTDFIKSLEDRIISFSVSTWFNWE